MKTNLPGGALSFTSIFIIGVGLIGGSIAAAIKALDNQQFTVRAVDIDSAAINVALGKGFIDEGLVLSADDVRINELLSAQALVDLVILATPVSEAAAWFERIEACGYSGAITDVASTKTVLTDVATSILSLPERYIPGHPMAGSEVNGIEGARATMFQNAHWILCPDEYSDPEIYTKLHEFVCTLGARSISLDRAQHDETIAVVSHVPHMIASALVQLAGAHARDKQEIFRLAAGGFKDTTRIAAGSPELWCGIAFDNKDALNAGLSEIKDVIESMQDSLQTDDKRKLLHLLSEAANLRAQIPPAWVPDSARLVEVRISMANHSGVVAQVTSFAAKASCNIQSINIDHINESTAILELILTDEGNFGNLMNMLIEGGFDVSFRLLNAAEQ